MADACDAPGAGASEAKKKHTYTAPFAFLFCCRWPRAVCAIIPVAVDSMSKRIIDPRDELQKKLKWLMLLRLVFTAFLLGSTILLQFRENPSSDHNPLVYLYYLVGGIFGLSFLYSSILRHGTRLEHLARAQTSLDTIVVTLIIYLTGGFYSVFSFLYLVVIIYSSILLYKRWGLMMAALSVMQYGVLIVLECYNLLNPFTVEGAAALAQFNLNYALYKIIFTSVACFAVALLSGILSEQTRKTKKELLAMEDHVRRVEKMASMGEMAAGLAHEIKNPLASLAGSIQLLREELDYHPDHDRLMQIVLRETDRLSALVTNFLLFARPPASRPEKIVLDSALNEIIALFEKDHSLAGKVTISKQLIPNIWVKFDPMHLRQIIWNLLLNAAEAISDKGHVAIRMSNGKANQVGICISDNGCGMSEDTMRSIFDPFFTTKSKGTGLGLSIVHRILESYDGRLRVESAIGQGSAFSMTLKRCQADR